MGHVVHLLSVAYSEALLKVFCKRSRYSNRTVKYSIKAVVSQVVPRQLTESEYATALRYVVYSTGAYYVHKKYLHFYAIPTYVLVTHKLLLLNYSVIVTMLCMYMIYKPSQNH